MSKIAADKLGQDKLQQLLAAVGAQSQDDISRDIEASDYDWRQPRYFSLQQMAMLRQFSEQLAEQCSEKFRELYPDGRLSVASVTQVSAETVNNEAGQNACFIAFQSESQNPFGVLRVPNASAVAWTGRILGGDDQSDGTGRKLSKLEESFLADIADSLIDVFSRVYGQPVHPDESIVTEFDFETLNGSDELLVITIQVRRSDSDQNPTFASFLTNCSRMDSIAGRQETEAKLSPAQIAAILQQHIHRMPLPVCVELGTVKLPFRDIMNLETDDIIVLDKKITEPMDILIDRQKLFRGRLARSGDRHAVVIV